MVDSIVVATNEFKLKDKINFHFVSDVDLFTNEVFYKLYSNKKTYNVTINKEGFRLQCSLPKLFGLRDNFYPIGLNSFEIAINNLKNELKSDGIVVDLENAKILRLDLFKNVRTSYNFNTYAEVLKMLGLKRTYKRVYPDGFLSGNTLREVCFYNKVKEMSDSLGYGYIKQCYNFTDENIVRGEIRLLRHMEVKKNNINLLKDLKNEWDNLKSIYSNYMSEVFKFNAGDNLNSEVLKPEVLRALIFEALFYFKQYGKKAFKRYGFYPFCFLPDDELKKVLSEKYEKAQVYTILSQIDNERKEVVFNIYEYKKLYDELKEKFLNNNDNEV